MSLNSLQDDMSRRAASMAAMARRATNPEEIQAIQKSLITGVQNGSIQPYVGIPLIQDLTKKLTEAKARMAQSVAGAGMPQPPAGGLPIAQQVMQQAAQESQGVEALPSNLPQSYTGGGIIAFEGGGEVERYQSGGTPINRWFSGAKQNFNETDEAAKLRTQLQMKYGPAASIPGLFMTQTDEERQFAKNVAAALPTMSLEQLKQLVEQGVLPAAPADPGAAPAPARAAPGAAIPGAGNFKNPTLQTYVPTAAVLPVRTMGDLTNLDAITKDAEARKKTAFNTKAAASQRELEGFDKPGFEAREEKLGKREAAQEKDSAIGRALNMIRLGFGVAGSKEPTLAGALSNEGREGITALIQGEAANRAARERLDDARDNFEQQKVQAKKGNYQASQTAGREASQDVQAAIQLALTGAQAGNAQAINLYNALMQGDIGKATVSNQAEQIKLLGVDQQNRNELGLAGLNVERLKINQSAAAANATLKMQERRFNAMDDANKARIITARNNALKTFMEQTGNPLIQKNVSNIGPNWQTDKDKRSLDAQFEFNRLKQAYINEVTNQAIDALSVRQADFLLLDQ